MRRLTNNFATWPLRQVVTARCSARCAHCHHEGVSVPMADLDADRFRREVGQGFFAHFTQVSITGGEPLLHPDIRAIVRHVTSSSALPVAVNTNGLAHPDCLAGLLKLRLTAVHISVHSSDADVNARVFAMPYDRSRVLHNARAVIDSGVGLCINRVILRGINSEPEEVVDFAEQWSELGARVRLYPNLYETVSANKQIITGILAEALRLGYRCRCRGRHHHFDHVARGSFTWTSPCTPEAMDPPDYAQAAVFMTPHMGLKRMLSPREWPWEPGFNQALPLALRYPRPSSWLASGEARRSATVEVGP